jgi:hypothetical protein
MISITPGDFLNPCGLYYKYMSIRLIKPIIVIPVISRVVYNLGDPQLDQVMPAFSNNKGITGDSKLAMNY